MKAQTIQGIFERRWQPEAEPKAAVIIVHGYAEHSGRYSNMAEHLRDRGYAAYAFDLRGHGRSEGLHGLVKSFNEYLTDLERFLSYVREREMRRPIFLLGHSLGGTIVCLFTIVKKPDVAGLVLSGPYLKIPNDVSPWLLNLTLAIGPVLPRLPVAKKIESHFISRDPEVVKRYDNDPLVYRGMMRAQTAAEIIRAVKRIQTQMETITLPLLILHGTGDRLADIEGSKQLYNRAGSIDKTLKLYDGLYHEVLNEPEKEKVLADMFAWLDAHV